MSVKQSYRTPARDRIFKLLSISMAHVTDAGVEYLKRSPRESALSVYQLAEFGFLVWVPEESDLIYLERQGVPPCVRRVLEFAFDRGCEWVILDDDAPEIRELPVYERESTEGTEEAR